MTAHYKILLSYDADTAFYKFKNQTFDYDKINEQNQKFRTSFLALLIKNGAIEIESSVASTIVFEIHLEQNINPIKYFTDIFSENFDDEEFRYMILATVETEYGERFDSNDGDSIHIINFSSDLRAAKKLLPKSEE